MPHLVDERTPPEIFAAAMAVGGGRRPGVRARRGSRDRARRPRAADGGGARARCRRPGVRPGTQLRYQAFSPTRCDRLAAALIRAQVPADAPVFTVGYYNQTLPFYLGRTVTLVNFTGEFELGERRRAAALDCGPRRFRATLARPARRRGGDQADLFARLEQHGVPMRVLYRDARRVVLSRT